MNYVPNNPEKDFSKALGLSEDKKTELEALLSTAVVNSVIARGSKVNLDALTAEMAPSLNTPEDAYYVATLMMSLVSASMAEAMGSL